METDSDRQARPATQIPTAAETMAELAEIPSPHKAPPEMQSRPRQRPQEGVLTPRELAAAFSIQYDPTMDASGKLRRGAGGKNLLVVVMLLLFFGGGASIFYFVPSLRQRFIAWVQNSEPAPAVVPQNSSNQQKSVPDGNPAWMNYVPDETPPITTPAKLSSSGSSTAGGASNSTGSTTATNTLAIANHPTASVPNSPAPVPPPVIDSPVMTSTPVDPATVAAADAASKLRQSSGGDLDLLAMKLRNNGLDAEARQDYAAAQYYYQQVELLPSDHWPGDIDRLLKNVQKRIAGGGAQ